MRGVVSSPSRCGQQVRGDVRSDGQPGGTRFGSAFLIVFSGMLLSGSPRVLAVLHDFRRKRIRKHLGSCSLFSLESCLLVSHCFCFAVLHEL